MNIGQILSDLNPFNSNSPLYLFPGPSLTQKQQQQGPTVTPGPNNLIYTQGQQQTTTQVANQIPVISQATDFLNWISWLFYPQNILRAVEFGTGILLGGYGLWLLTSRPGRGLARAAVTATPVGRVIRVQQGARMGRHEGQREAARMRARQQETYSTRLESARERERIRRHARQNP